MKWRGTVNFRGISLPWWDLFRYVVETIMNGVGLLTSSWYVCCGIQAG